jgi:hypothetical protein
MGIGRAQRIPIDPTRADFGSPPSLDGVVEPHHEWPVGIKVATSVRRRMKLACPPLNGTV